MVLRYSNPNPVPIVGEVTVTPTSPAISGGELDQEGERASLGDAVTHQVLLNPTGGEPEFVTVSGDKGIYASPFDLEPGQWTVSVKIPNDDPEAEDILVVSEQKIYLKAIFHHWISIYIQKVFGSGGIRTHASEETGALNQRLRPLGHATLLRGKPRICRLSVAVCYPPQKCAKFQGYHFRITLSLCPATTTSRLSSKKTFINPVWPEKRFHIADNTLIQRSTKI